MEGMRTMEIFQSESNRHHLLIFDTFGMVADRSRISLEDLQTVQDIIDLLLGASGIHTESIDSAMKTHCVIAAWGIARSTLSHSPS
jgi:hypothetical protein